MKPRGQRWDILSRLPLRLYPVQHILPVGQSCRLLYASDLHLTPWTAHVVDQIVQATVDFQPDVVVLGGDLLDAPWALHLLETLADQLARLTTVVAILGNHDRFLFPRRIARTLRNGGVALLDGPWQHASGLILHATPQAAGATSVFVAHNPSDFPRAARAGFPLTLAGHLHGCQWIAWEKGGLQYPGAWFFAYNGREFWRQHSRMIVSLGVNDTVPLRWNCPREVLAVEISKGNP